MHRWAPHAATVAGLALAASTLAGCADAPQPVPTIGSPSPSASAPTQQSDRSAALARQWGLTGQELPGDWPDVPLPRDTEVVAAYAIGAEPRRTWTATFTTDRGTALDLAEPVVAELRERGYVPIAEYVGAASTNTGLYSFAAPTFAVYVVLGEDDGRPNLLITVKGSTDPSAGLPSDLATLVPSGTATPGPTRTASPGAAGASSRATPDTTPAASTAP